GPTMMLASGARRGSGTARGRSPARRRGRSRPVSNPESDERQEADAQGETDESLGNGSDAAKAEAPGVLWVLNLLSHVVDDVAELGVGEVPGEDWHVARPGPQGFGDLRRRDVAERRRERAVRERVTVSGDRVAGRAVEGEQ